MAAGSLKAGGRGRSGEVREAGLHGEAKELKYCIAKKKKKSNVREKKMPKKITA